MIKADSKTDAKMAKAAEKTTAQDYNVVTNSCIDVCSKALEAGGFDGGNKQGTVNRGGDGPVYEEKQTYQPKSPNERYQAIKANNEGEVIKF